MNIKEHTYPLGIITIIIWFTIGIFKIINHNIFWTGYLAFIWGAMLISWEQEVKE